MGSKVADLKVGDKVTSLVSSGGYAEYAIADAGKAIPIPNRISFAQAASIPVQGLSAYTRLKYAARPQSRESLLVQAAAGGVGLYLVQLARIMGVRKIVALASSDRKVMLLRSLGANVVVNYSRTNLEYENGEGVRMRVAELWRYPVKSLAGERVQRAELACDGLIGDRIVQVYDRRGRIVTSRTHPRLLKLRATLGHDGEPLVEGLPWRSPGARALVEQAVSAGARLRRFDGPERFDILPLLVCTDGAIGEFGRDRRRLRPNIVIGGVEGLAERTWQGETLTIGDALVGLADLRGRCVMTTYDPDTIEQDRSILRDIVHRFGGQLCLNARVLRAGVVDEGVAVQLQV